MIIQYSLEELRQWNGSPGLEIYTANIQHVPVTHTRAIDHARAVVVVDHTLGMVHFIKSVNGMPLFVSWYDFLMWMGAQP